MGAKIIGFGRSSSLEAAEKRHISEYYVKPNLAVFLQKCDYFVNVLPSTPETQKLLNGNILENCTGIVLFLSIYTFTYIYTKIVQDSYRLLNT